MSKEPEEIEEFLNSYHFKARAIEKDLIDICFYMRGGINIDQAYQLTLDQQNMCTKRIKKNIEQTEKSGIALV